MHTKELKSVLRQLSLEDIHVIDISISRNDYMPIDLSKANTALDTIDISSSRAWQTFILNSLNKQNKIVAYGGYLEKRALYNRSSYFINQNFETDRNIHLGLDLWTAAGTSVLAAVPGKIHSFKDNTNFGDYGPTVILEHQLHGLKFYTLYGHLSRASLTHLNIGAKVGQGEVIAHLGTAAVNGDYAPHLHFQIIKDLQSNVGDYPGVCSLRDLEFYKNNTFNPEIILGL